MVKNNLKIITKLLFKKTNNMRKRKKLSYLKYDRGLNYLCRKHSRKMSKAGKIWHGNNMRIAVNYIDGKKATTWQRFIFGLQGRRFNGIAGECCAMMFKGRVKGFKKMIITDADIASALLTIWMRSPLHRACFVDSKWKKVGFGIHRRKNQFYATALFYG